MHKQTRNRIDERKARVEVTKEGLEKLRRFFLPAGSGPLGAMAYVCALIELLAEAKGIQLDD